MKRLNFLAIALVFALGLAAAPVFAQATPPATGGTTAPPGSEIDLPIGTGHATVAEPDDPPVEDDTPTIYDEDLPTTTESIIYVLDISGSMDWGVGPYTGLDGNPTSGTRLDRAKAELIRSIQGLTEDFKFNVFAYDCDLQRWSPARQQAVPAAKASASGWVSSRQAMGATGTGPAVAAALGDKDNFCVVLLSDGAPNCIGYSSGSIAQHRAMIRAANTQGAVIHCFGIGAYGEFEQFLRDVARDSGGQYFPVP